MWFPSGVRMPGEVRNAGDNAVAPVVDDLPGLLRPYFTRKAQVALIFVRKPRTNSQFRQFPHRNRGPCGLDCPVRVPGMCSDTCFMECSPSFRVHRIRRSTSSAIVLICGGWLPASLSSRW